MNSSSVSIIWNHAKRTLTHVQTDSKKNDVKRKCMSEEFKITIANGCKQLKGLQHLEYMLLFSYSVQEKQKLLKQIIENSHIFRGKNVDCLTWQNNVKHSPEMKRETKLQFLL